MSASQSYGQISIKVVDGFDEMVQAVSIRAAVYIGEMGRSFRDDWDGNDFSATHLLALVDGEPAGTMRIRYFGDFAKPERVAVLGRFRKKRYGSACGVAGAMCEHAREICRRKGYTRIYVHARTPLVSFYRKVSGGMAAEFGPEFVPYEGDPHIAMVAEYEPTPGAVGYQSGPGLIGCREGDWPIEIDRPVAAKHSGNAPDDGDTCTG